MAQFLQVVNRSRKLGKEQSLAALREYRREDLEDWKVLVICRLLFVNPEGWSPPRFGSPSPRANEDAVKRFPFFPIALSDNVPFFVAHGYIGSGAIESGDRCLDLCEGFSMIQEDYPLTGYEKAAKALTQSESFRKLYGKQDLQQMIEMILHQASERK